MKKRSVGCSFIILLIAAAAVFFAGWVQFQVRSDEIGILVSKTGGVNDTPIARGTFSWRWEKIIPTNAKIRKFKIKPEIISEIVKGELPSAKIYSKLVKDEPDFSYYAKITLTVGITEEGLVNYVKTQDLKNNEELTQVLRQKSQIGAKKVTEYLLDNYSKNSLFVPSAVSSEEIAHIFSNDPDFKYIDVKNAQVADVRFPDLEMYRKAKKIYDGYNETLEASIKKQAELNAKNILDESRSMQQLEKFGEVLKKYPDLKSLFENNDPTTVLNALKSY